MSAYEAKQYLDELIATGEFVPVTVYHRTSGVIVGTAPQPKLSVRHDVGVIRADFYFVKVGNRFFKGRLGTRPVFTYDTQTLERLTQAQALEAARILEAEGHVAEIVVAPKTRTEAF